MQRANTLIETFRNQREPDRRYASFDYCYNHFRSRSVNRKVPATSVELQVGCLHLASYLASWGMYRGSSFLLREKSARCFLPLVRLIESGELDDLWQIDCDKYTEANIARLIHAYDAIYKLVVIPGAQHLILVTKIMLGVFGCVPAFDSRATDSLRSFMQAKSGWSNTRVCGFRRFNEDALKAIQECYVFNRTVVDKHAGAIHTLDFGSGMPTKYKYTNAKVLDMLLFQANGKPFSR